MNSVLRLFRVWLPTALGSSMLVVEIPVVYAAVTRTAHGGQALAALGICLSILVVVNTPALALTPLVVVEARRCSPRLLWRYSLAIGCGAAAVLAVLGGVAPVAAVVTGVFGLDAALAVPVRWSLLALAPNALAVAMRRYLHGRFIQAERTGPITTATILRIIGTGVLAWSAVALLPGQGAVAGALALSSGAFVEAAWLALALRRLARPPPPTSGGSIRAMVRRHAQLSVARLLNMVPQLITTVAIAHSTGSTAALIVWPALYELGALFFTPTMDFESVATTALRRDRHDQAPARLMWWLSGGFTLVFTLVLTTGIGAWFVRGFLDVPPEPAEMGLRWAPLLVAVPALWLVRGYLRARVMAMDATARLVLASAAHAAVLTVAALGLSLTPMSGVAVACLAILAGLGADIILTGRGQAPSCPAPAMPARS